MMPEFELHFEWEESPRSRAAEFAATWARLEMRAGGATITKVEARRNQSVRSGIYIPLYPIAESMVRNWWPLWEEWRSDGADERHRLLEAREGFALPDVRFYPTETRMRIQWGPPTTHAPDGADILFLTQGECQVAKESVQAEFRRLVEGVLERLRTRAAGDRGLQAEWDAEQRAFCEKAARLGLDPFSLPAEAAAEVEGLSALVAGELADDLYDAVSWQDLGKGGRAVRQFVGSALATEGAAGDWERVVRELAIRGAENPWQEGHQVAGALRAMLRWEGPLPQGFDTALGQQLGAMSVREFGTGRELEAIAAPTQRGSPMIGVSGGRAEPRRRFLVCRALGGFLARGGAALVTGRGTERQRRNLAFAAEFLAPAAAIRERLPQGRLGEEDLAELAATLTVSEWVIRHQVENHGLAEIAD